LCSEDAGGVAGRAEAVTEAWRGKDRVARGCASPGPVTRLRSGSGVITPLTFALVVRSRPLGLPLRCASADLTPITGVRNRSVERGSVSRASSLVGTRSKELSNARPGNVSSPRRTSRFEFVGGWRGTSGRLLWGHFARSKKTGIWLFLGHLDVRTRINWDRFRVESVSSWSVLSAYSKRGDGNQAVRESACCQVARHYQEMG
jgi:hypothetical protein